MKRAIKRFLTVSAAACLALPSASACSVCYGEPDAPMTRGLSWAIIALAGIVGVVLIGVAGFFVHVNRRTNALEPAGESPENATLRS
ncbi:MAG: hypothetical protein V9H26_02880 [Verrucomicrobiota bacterium]|nr:hypothetical protein [Verrucomicrobiota bacterium]MCC6822269.1 hypothetical protein [Limisphaerales bacterium]